MEFEDPKHGKIVGESYVSGMNIVENSSAISLYSFADIPAEWGIFELLKKMQLCTVREPCAREVFDAFSGEVHAIPEHSYIIQVDGVDQQPIDKKLFHETYREVSPGVFMKEPFTRVIHIPKGVIARVHSPVSTGSHDISYPYAIGIDLNGKVYPFPYEEHTTGESPNYRVAGRVSSLDDSTLFGDEGIVVKKREENLLEVDCRLTRRNCYFAADNEVHMKFAVSVNAAGSFNLEGVPSICDGNGMEVQDPNATTSLSRLIQIVSDSEAVLSLRLFGQDLLQFRIDKDSVEVQQRDELDLFDIRQLTKAQENYEELYLSTRVKHGFHRRTDLHTHFAGEVPAGDLIEIALLNNNSYPSSLLREIGVEESVLERYDSDGEVLLRGILRDEEEGWAVRKKLKAAMELGSCSYGSFSNLEAIFRFRSPISKHPANFEAILTSIARHYESDGVEYAELSISNIIEPQFLEKALRIIPSIKADTGVELRFLVGLWRHNPSEYNNRIIERTLHIARHTSLIAGVDFMGHETNSAQAFEEQIRTAAQYRMDHDPSFQIRVHGGENPLNPQNVAIAINAGATRIGHGLYGIDDEVIADAAAKGVVFEYQLPSNQSLSNVNSTDPETMSAEVPIKKLIEASVPVVLGSDGSGIYLCDGSAIQYSVQRAGLSAEDFAYLADCEGKYLSSIAANRKHAVPLPEEILEELPEISFDWTLWEEAQKRELELVLEKLNELGIKYVEPSALLAEFAGKRPIMISGGSWKSWDDEEFSGVTPEQKETAYDCLRAMYDRLHLHHHPTLTGGTKFGVEKVAQEIARSHGGQVLGTLTQEVFRVLDDIDERLTHATILGERWFDKSVPALQFVKESGGIVIFIGGGIVVQDEITAALNAGIDFLVMDGPRGSSTNRAKLLVGTPFESNIFTDSASLLAALGKRGFTFRS